MKRSLFSLKGDRPLASGSSSVALRQPIPTHWQLSLRIILETIAGITLIGMMIVALETVWMGQGWIGRGWMGQGWIGRSLHPLLFHGVLLVPLVLLLLVQGLCLNRCYLVGHEAVHRKLFPQHLWLNDLIGSVMLLPILAPLTIYRKIHTFHHAYNREAVGISTLDTFISHHPITPSRQRLFYGLWIFLVFGGGFFLHTLISIVLFLLLPSRWGERLSPAFQNWTMMARLRAWAEFAVGIGFHLGVYSLLGASIWLSVLGLPLLMFAWIWSMLLYIYHYRTSVGTPTCYNVRSLTANRFWRWLMLNFNEHTTHHSNPQLPWYLLPQKRVDLPEAYSHNQTVTTLWQAIAQQLKGPNLVESQRLSQ
jgi:fatty acid desaturase